jgi:hypothetical protein
MKRERAHIEMVFPQVDALLEGLLVARLLVQRARVPAHALRDGTVDGRTETLGFLVCEEIGNNDKAVALEGGNVVRRNGVHVTDASALTPVHSRTEHGLRTPFPVLEGSGPRF